MTLKKGSCVLVGVSLAATLLLGCASSSRQKVPPAEQLRTAVNDTVVDPDRRDEMTALSDEYLDLLDRLVAEVEEGRRALEGLVADYSSDRDQFDAFFAEYAEKRSRVADRAIEVHLAMKEIVTEEEWTSLEKATQEVTTAMLTRGLVDAQGEE